MSHHSANWGKNGKLQGCQRTKRKSLKEIRKGNCPPPKKARRAAIKKGTGSKGNYKKTKHGSVRALIHCGFYTSIGFKNLQVESYVYGWVKHQQVSNIARWTYAGDFIPNVLGLQGFELEN